MGRMEVWEGRKCGEKRNARNVGAVARKEVGVKEGNMGREGNCKIFRIFFAMDLISQMAKFYLKLTSFSANNANSKISRWSLFRESAI